MKTCCKFKWEQASVWQYHVNVLVSSPHSEPLQTHKTASLSVRDGRGREKHQAKHSTHEHNSRSPSNLSLQSHLPFLMHNSASCCLKNAYSKQLAIAVAQYCTTLLKMHKTAHHSASHTGGHQQHRGGASTYLVHEPKGDHAAHHAEDQHPAKPECQTPAAVQEHEALMRA